MDLTIEQSSLARALRAVGRIVPTRTTLPVLQAAVLAARDGRLTLRATDIELALTTSIAADVAVPGETALPARLLAEYVTQLPTGPVRLTLEPERGRVRVTAARFVARVATLDPTEFPTVPALVDDRAIDLDATTFRAALGRVSFAAARDESRPVLAAVLFAFGAEGLTLAAADGFRLARVHLPGLVAAEQALLVPARAVAEFVRLLEGTEGVRLVPAADGRGVALRTGETTLYTRLIEGTYPDVERVIPRECATRVTVDAASFRQAVRMSGLFASGDARPVVVEAGRDGLHLRARGDETGDVESDLPATVHGEPRAVALNTRLLTDLLDVVEDGQIEISWNSPQTPVRVQEAVHAADGAVWVVMPLHDPALTRAVGEQKAA